MKGQGKTNKAGARGGQSPSSMRDVEATDFRSFGQGDKNFEMQHAAGPENNTTSSSSQYQTSSSSSKGMEDDALEFSSIKAGGPGPSQ